MTKEVDITIEGLGSEGDGVAKFKDKSLFVPFTAPGDLVRVEVGEGGKHGLPGKLLEVLEESPDRVKPKCQHFGICGGCSLQHISENLYRDWLKSRIETALSHQLIYDAPFYEAYISPAGARRRVSVKMVRDGGVKIGFNRWRSHDLVDVMECPVSDPKLVAAMAALRGVFKDAFSDIRFCRIELTLMEGGVDVVFQLPRPPKLPEAQILLKAMQDNGLARLTVIENGVPGSFAEFEKPFVTFGGARVYPPPGCFLQATRDGEQVLQDFVLENLGKAKNAAELFAGLGTFSLPLAARAKVLAVDADKPLLAALEKAYRNTKGLKKIDVLHRDLFRRPLSIMELKDFDAVVLDPPRAGALAQSRMIASSKVGKVIYVSCNPNTFGRDARVLIDGGYELKTIKPVGQFLWSHHVELASVFERV